MSASTGSVPSTRISPEVNPPTEIAPPSKPKKTVHFDVFINKITSPPYSAEDDFADRDIVVNPNQNDDDDSSLSSLSFASLFDDDEAIVQAYTTPTQLPPPSRNSKFAPLDPIME